MAHKILSDRSIRSGISKDYVDRKFINLAANLSSKVNLTGGTMTGPLDMLDNKITSSYVPVDDDDVINIKYLSTLSSASGTMSDVAVNTHLLLKVNKTGDTMSGDLNMGMNKVSSSHVPNLDSDLINKRHFDEMMAGKLGQYNLEHIMNNLSLKVSQDRDGILTGPLNAGAYKLTSTYIPRNPEDLINNAHLNMMYIPNNCGYIPDIVGNTNNKRGFEISASSEFAGHTAYHVFCSWKGRWKVNSKDNMYIQVKCPELVRLNRITLRGNNQNTDRIFNWNLQASKDGFIWATLYSATDTYIGSTIQGFSVTSSPLASYYKIVILDGEGTNPTLNHWQLYTYDGLERPKITSLIHQLYKTVLSYIKVFKYFEIFFFS